MARVFLAAEWRHLIMLNWPIDPAILQSFVPPGVELDAHDGVHYVSVVGFLFLKTRVLGFTVPWHVNFEEINLRFYVRRRHPDGDRRGVIFIKEIVPRPAIALTARVVYNENYVALPTRNRVELTDGALRDGSLVRYAWRFRGKTNAVRGRVAGAFAIPPAGSEPEFITEHYWGYALQRDGGTVEYQVEHPQWRVAAARDARLECDVAALYGPQFAEPLARPPASAFIAEGSPIVVKTARRIA